MANNNICKLLQRLHVSLRGFTAPKYSTAVSSNSHPLNKFEFIPSSVQVKHSIFEPNLRLTTSFQSNSQNFDLPTHRGWINTIIDSPIPRNDIMDPKINYIEKEDKRPQNSIYVPTITGIIEKQAARLIVIRRRKMRRHKLRKLRKKMKYIWAKRKQRRELKKEKAFHAELLAQIRQAEDFDAKSYVQSRLDILDNVRIPNKWHGEILPEAMVRQFMKEEADKRMSRKIIPRVKL